MTQQTAETDVLDWVAEKAIREAQTEQSKAGRVVWDKNTESKPMVLWDVIDQSWTKPMEAENVFQLYLRKLCFRCTVCTFTSIHTGQVASHIAGVTRLAVEHRGAKPTMLLNGSQVVVVCSGCSASFKTMAQARGHIDQSKAMDAPHANAKELLVRRFLLRAPDEKPQAVVIETPQSQNGTTEWPRKRKRRQPLVR